MLVPNFQRAYLNDKGLNYAIYIVTRVNIAICKKIMSVTRVDVNKYRYTIEKQWALVTGSRSPERAIPQKFQTKILKAMEQRYNVRRETLKNAKNHENMKC